MRAAKARRIRHQAVRIVRDNPEIGMSVKTPSRKMRRHRPLFINGVRGKLWSEK